MSKKESKQIPRLFVLNDPTVLRIVPSLAAEIGLRKNDKVTIEVTAGWEGGYVSRIETTIDFGCANFYEFKDGDK